jgi:hypothetical protein
MRNRLIGFGFVVVVLAVAAVGCGGSSNTYSCNFAASIGLCYDYSSPQALTAAQVTQLQNACTAGAAAGAFSTTSSCPSAGRVGSCALPNTQMTGVTIKYAFYSPNYTAASGQQFCTTNLTGTWTAG